MLIPVYQVGLGSWQMHTDEGANVINVLGAFPKYMRGGRACPRAHNSVSGGEAWEAFHLNDAWPRLETVVLKALGHGQVVTFLVMCHYLSYYHLVRVITRCHNVRSCKRKTES